MWTMYHIHTKEKKCGGEKKRYYPDHILPYGFYTKSYSFTEDVIHKLDNNMLNITYL